MFRFFGCLLLCWALLGLYGLFRDIKIFGPVSGLVKHPIKSQSILGDVWHSAYYTFCQSQTSMCYVYVCSTSLDIQINDTFLVYYVCNSVAARSLAISSTMDQINANLDSNILLHTTHASWRRNLHKFTINVYHADFKGGIQLSI